MPQTVLIIDDSKPLHGLVKVHLGTEDFVFESAFTGSEALGLAASVRPDLILLDVDLPDMNGFDVCRFLKANANTARIPVIFLTASASTDEKACGLELEAADYITKPFNHEELSQRVRAALRTKRLIDMLSTDYAEAAVSPSIAPVTNARLSFSQLQEARNQNPWKRRPPAANVGS